MNNQHALHALVAAAILGVTAGSAHAKSHIWQVGLAAADGTPSGVVQVRENRIEGTRLDLRNTLGVSHVTSLRLSAIHRLGSRSELHLWLSITQLDGSGVLTDTAYFNGATLSPGPVSSNTHYLDDWRLTADYWRRVLRFRSGGGLWLSGGLTYVGLNFKIGARVTVGSTGHETKEDFITQELPVPIVGIHLRYPICAGLSLFGGIQGGHLPWTNSLRREGGMVQVTQTNEDADVGVSYQFSETWSAQLYVFDRRYMQNERSSEDGNFIRLNVHGIGIALAGRL